MSDKISLIIEATDNASSVLGGIGQSIGNLGRIAGGLALGGVAAMGAGLLKLGSDGLSLNNSMEKVTAQLNAFTKDGAKTADIIETVRTRAAKTPFEFDAMAKAAVALFPASKTAQGGLEGILEKAEILAASNPAEGLEGAAFALKEAVSGDFTSIIERFNLPRQYINDLKKEGVPNLEIVQRAMKEMGLDVDLVSNLANTAEGRWSTFKDTLTNVAAQATKPIFEAMSGGIAQVNTYLEANGPLLNQIGTTIAGTLTQGITALSAVLPQIIAGFSGIGQVLSSSNVYWESFSAIVQLAIASATATINTWLPVVQSVLGGIAAFLQTHSAQIQLLISTAWATITTIIQTAITTATTVINAFAPVVLAIFGEISAFLNANGADILATITSVWESVGAIIKTVSEIVKATVIPAFAAIAGFIKDHGAEIQAVLSGAWAVIKTVVTSAIDTIKGVLNLGLAIIRGDWGAAWKEIQGITETSNNLIKTVINTAMTLIEGGIKLAVDNFKRGWEMGWQLMQTATDTAMTLIKDAINNGIEKAKTVIADGVEAFLGKFRDLRDKMSVIGQQLLEGMVQGIRDKVGWLVDEAVRASNAVLAAIKNTLGIKSPSDEAISIAGYLMQGGAIGVKENAYLWVDASKNVANDLIYTFDSGLGTVLINSKSTFERIAQTVAPIVQLADTTDFVMGRIENSAQSMASAVSASMAAAGNSISTTAGQLAQFVQSGGVGGITGGIYTPSAAFQALFTNPPPAPIIAPPRPSSVPKQETTNNNVVINLDVYGVDERTAKTDVTGGVLAGLQRAGVTR